MTVKSRKAEQALPRLHFSLAPEPSRLLRARERIRDYLALHCSDATAVNDVVLAVEEAATNAIRHSGSSECLEVELYFHGHDLVAEVRDHGRGFDIDRFDPTVVPDPLAPGGRGLFLIAALMDDFALCRDGGLGVSMRKLAVPMTEETSRIAVGVPDGGVLQRGPDHTQVRDRSFVEEIPEGYAALDWEYRLTYVNANALALYGLGRDQVIGRTVWELFSYLEATPLGEALRAAMELGVPTILEYESPYLGRFIEYRVYPTRSGLSFYSRDIDERKRKEQERDELFAALRDSEERYRGLFQSESDALLLIDHESGRVLEANPAAATIYGYTTEELLGLTDLDLSADPELTRSSTRSAAVGENVTVPSRRHRRKDGAAFAVEMTGRVFTLQGRLVRVVAVRDVSARKRAEEALGRFELLAANSRDIILFMDRDGRIIEANEAAERVYGYTHDELLELTIADLRADRTWSEMAAQMAAADERGILFESLHRRRDGSVFPVEVSSRGATVSGHRTLVSIVRDITERRQSEQALRESEERFRLALRNAPVSVALQDRELRYLWAYNQRTASRDEIIGKLDSEIFTPEEAAHATAVKRRVLDEDVELREQMWLERPEGPVYLDITWEPLHDDAGNVVGVSSATVDLTAMKTAEAALAASEERFRGFVQASSDVVYRMSPDGREMRQLVGSEFIAGTDSPSDSWLDDYIHPDEHERMLAAIRRAIDSKSVFELEHRARRVDGTPVWMRSRAVPRFDADGEIVEWIGTATDITAQRQAQQAREEAARLGEALNAIDALVHSSLHAEQIIQTALREGAQAIGAERAGLSLHEDDAQRFRVAYVHNHPPDRVGVLIPDSEDTHGVEALRTGKTVAIDETQTDPRVARALMDAWQIKSVICAPLVVQGKPIGVAYYSYCSTSHRFSGAEIDFMTRLASSLSTAVENATLYEAQRDIATALQHSILPTPPRLEQVELGIVGLPAAQAALVGGDFWDVFELPGRKLLVVIGDVAGKGVSAAALTETVRATMRAFATVDDSPAFILRKTNDLLLARERDEFFVTALVVVMDADASRLAVGSAGHPGPMHLTPHSCATIEPTYGPPLGSFAADYTSCKAELAQGDYLVLYTDGVTEARRSGQMFGERRLAETLGALRGEGAQDVADALASAASTFADALRDDAQVLVVRRT